MKYQNIFITGYKQHPKDGVPVPTKIIGLENTKLKKAIGVKNFPFVILIV